MVFQQSQKCIIKICNASRRILTHKNVLSRIVQGFMFVYFYVTKYFCKIAEKYEVLNISYDVTGKRITRCLYNFLF